MLKALGGKKVTLKWGLSRWGKAKKKIRDCSSYDKLDLALDSIANAARTGKIGDGKIFVKELNGSTRIRTERW